MRATAGPARLTSARGTEAGLQPSGRLERQGVCFGQLQQDVNVEVRLSF